MVRASGGIAGILGAYILLHPKAAVRVYVDPWFLSDHQPANLVSLRYMDCRTICLRTGRYLAVAVLLISHISAGLWLSMIIPFFKHADIPLFDEITHQIEGQTGPHNLFPFQVGAKKLPDAIRALAEPKDSGLCRLFAGGLKGHQDRVTKNEPLITRLWNYQMRRASYPLCLTRGFNSIAARQPYPHQGLSKRRQCQIAQA